MNLLVSKIRRNRCVTALALGISLAAMTAGGPAALAQETAADAAKKPVVPPSPARLADGRPNWTGFWSAMGGLLDINIGLGGTPPPMPGMPPPPPMPFSNYPELKSPYKEKYGAFMQQLMAGKVADPVARCLPPGMPRMMTMVYGMELLQTPGQIAITSEWQAASRRIWLNRKDHPKPDELDPSYAGDSVGHWEGDTLVVDTIGVRDDVPLNYAGLPHSPKLRVEERFRESSPGVLIDDVTVDDPDVFVAPWTARQTYRYRPDLKIEEYVCLENNRNVGADGEAIFDKK